MLSARRLCTLALVVSGALRGSAILSVPHTTETDAVATSLGQIAAASFTLGSAYPGVSISLDLRNSFTGVEVLAYLMTQIGQGTTAAHEIASATATTVYGAPLTPLFTGVPLTAGTYYVVLSASSGVGYWSLGDNTEATISAGSSPGPGFFVFSTPSCQEGFGCLDSGYLPASIFTNYNPAAGPDTPWHTYALEVTESSGEAVPEPGFGAISAAVAAVLLAAARRRKAARS